MTNSSQYSVVRRDGRQSALVVIKRADGVHINDETGEIVMDAQVLQSFDSVDAAERYADHIDRQALANALDRINAM